MYVSIPSATYRATAAGTYDDVLSLTANSMMNQIFTYVSEAAGQIDDLRDCAQSSGQLQVEQAQQLLLQHLL